MCIRVRGSLFKKSVCTDLAVPVRCIADSAVNKILIAKNAEDSQSTLSKFFGQGHF